MKNFTNLKQNFVKMYVFFFINVFLVYYKTEKLLSITHKKRKIRKTFFRTYVPKSGEKKVNLEFKGKVYYIFILNIEYNRRKRYLQTNKMLE